MSHSVPSLNDPSLLKNQSYINGKWVDAKSGKTFSVTDPASGKEIGKMPEMDDQDVKLAIQAAQEAFPSFRKTTGRERSRMLRKWYAESMGKRVRGDLESVLGLSMLLGTLRPLAACLIYS